MIPRIHTVALSIIAMWPWPAGADEAAQRPMRPLPEPSDRLMSDGPAFFVNASVGSDDRDGSKNKPWRTVNYALRQLAPGDTLYLRGGTYYEHVVIPRSGDSAKPLTIRSYPGELAVIDGGLREFFETRETAWAPLRDGAQHEYVSTRKYPQFTSRPITANTCFLRVGP